MKIAVVGAGWAGCAAGVELARLGHAVTLFESARVAGGRARRVQFDERVLDNGQHILLGAYRATLQVMKTVGIDQKQAVLRLPLQMRYPAGSGGMDFVAPRLPAPLHLLVALARARGLGRDDKLALARFSTTARWMDWGLDIDCTVSELLVRFEQTERLIQLMWRPLCIAALNTPPERASAQVFLNVLRDSLGARRAASDMLLPRTDLSALFPDHATARIERQGGKVLLGVTVKSLRADGSGWRLHTTGEPSEDSFDRVVIATQPAHAATLLAESGAMAAIPEFSYEPITTCYLQYALGFRLAQPFLALIDRPERNEWGQFVFDRGQLDARQAGLLAVVVSASSDAVAMGQDALTQAIAAQLSSTLGRPELATPVWSKVISEKRATFACTPALARPDNATSLAGVYLAGDYTRGDYPATIEGAVRSALEAVRLITA
jgi:squalene-associated FAD-dependent desaturase